MYRNRHLADAIERAARTFSAVVVTGPRQCGKTTLLRELFGKTHRYVTFDHPDVRARTAADPRGFLSDHPAPALFDEIQHAPQLLHHLKTDIDEHRTPGRWVLTGSQGFPLMAGVAESLAGRVAVLRLDPFSVAELAAVAVTSMDDLLERVFGASPASWVRQDLGAWILRGGYPEPCLRQDLDARLWFASYVDTYLARDVRDLLEIGDLVTFQNFLGMCAARSGRLLNMADLARDVGIAPTTARRWLSVLQTSQIVHLVQPWHENFGKRITKAPKLVFLDVGLCAWLLGLHTRDAILHGPSAGALAETAVIAEWIKAFRSTGTEPRIWHWSAHGGTEVDLVVDWNGRRYAIEVKVTATPTPGHAESLRRWASISGVQSGVVACQVDQPHSLIPGVRAVPWHLACSAGIAGTSSPAAVRG